jgi:hypothetical protein
MTSRSPLLLASLWALLSPLSALAQAEEEAPPAATAGTSAETPAAVAPSPALGEQVPAGVSDMPSTPPTSHAPAVVFEPAAPVALQPVTPPVSEVGADGKVSAAEPARPKEIAPGGDEAIKEEGLRVGGRVYAQWLWQNSRPEWDAHLESVRFGAKWSDGPIDTKVEFELFSTNADGDVIPSLRDAWVAYEVARPLQFKAGQMKKPFSRLELLSRADLPAISRGLVIDQLVEERGFGGRDMGAEVFGRVGKKLRLNYSAGLYQGGGVNTPEGTGSGPQHGAWAARVEVERKKVWSVGTNFSQRTVEPDEPRQRRPWAWGLDAEVTPGRWRVLAEFVSARNPDQLRNVTTGVGATGMVTYRLPLSQRWSVEPIVGAEWVKANLDAARHQQRFFAGASLVGEGGLRLMLEGENTSTTAEGAAAKADDRALVLQLAWDR